MDVGLAFSTICVIVQGMDVVITDVSEVLLFDSVSIIPGTAEPNLAACNWNKIGT